MKPDPDAGYSMTTTAKIAEWVEGKVGVRG